MAYELTIARLEAEYRSSGQGQVGLYRAGMRAAASQAPDVQHPLVEYHRKNPDFTVDATAFIKGYIALACAIIDHEREQPHGLHPS